jgi:hypothetical protein
VQFIAAYSAFLSFKCPGIAVKECPWETSDACLEIDAPSSCVPWVMQWSDWQHEAPPTSTLNPQPEDLVYIYAYIYIYIYICVYIYKDR